jgi:PAS domain S-box-containing protein
MNYLADEKNLRRCVRDLVALSALSAVWPRADAPHIAGNLADVLLRTLSADFIYVRVDGAAEEGDACEVVRPHQEAAKVREVGKTLEPAVGSAGSNPALTIANPVAPGMVRLTVVPIGIDGDCGFLAAGSQRPDFPSPTDKLLLGVATNQAAMVLQQKRAERALRESEARFRNMADTAPALLWISDSAGLRTYLSRGWYELTGQTTDTGLGFGWLEAIHPDDHERTQAAFLAANARHEPFALEYCLRRSDGEYFWAIDRGRPRFSDSGEFLGYVGAVLDITERKEAELLVYRSEERYRTLVNATTAIVWTTDAEYAFITPQPSWQAYTGQTWKECAGWGWIEAVHPEDRETVRALFEAAKRDGTLFASEGRLWHAASKNWRHFEARAAPLRDEQGKIREWVGTYIDVHDRVILESEQDRLRARDHALRQEAERASRLKDEFLATLSHELRTPLNAIIGWTHILRQSELDQQTARAVEVIDRNAKLQNQLIEDVLDVSRIVSGKLRLNVRSVDLVQVLESALDTIKPAADAKEIRLKKIVDPLAGPISGDPDRLQQVVWNLVSNAVKFSPRGGLVVVGLSRLNSHVEIAVEDKGSGIHPDFLPHVFERFRQQDSSTTRSHGGLGLGLAIVHHLVEMHGGQVTAESEGVGRGTVFRVKLPVLSVSPRQGSGVERHPTAEEQQFDSPMPSLEGISVLVVEDDKDARDVVTVILGQAGAEVVAVGSAAEALDLLPRRRWDVLLSDIEMPYEDGYSFIRKVRSLSPAEGGNIPATALTAHASTADRLRALQAGYQMHVPKPVHPQELAAVIASLARRTGRS